MNTFLVLLSLGLVALASSLDKTPVPPKAWPPVFWTWMMTTLVQENVTKPLLLKGQFVVYDSQNQYSCRYDEQPLVNVTKERGNDFCDYKKGMHYTVKDTTIPNPGCTSSVPTDTHTIPPLVWPADFLAQAEYLGTDQVNQNYCDHFVASPVAVEGQVLQVDAWFTNDTQQWPCQISAFELKQSPFYFVTWAFDAFNTTIPTDSKKCTLPRLQCAEPDYVCRCKRGVDTDTAGMALRFACDPQFLNCDSLNPGGANFEPNDVYSHADWAFNAYFQKYKNTQGELACDFGGLGELAPPPNSNKFATKTFGGVGVDPINWLKFDLVCA